MGRAAEHGLSGVDVAASGSRRARGRPSPERRGRTAVVVLLGASTGLLASGQPWSVRAGVDPAGVATRETWTGQELAPSVAAVLLVVAVATLAGVAWPGRPGTVGRALAGVSAATALGLTVTARPPDPTSWWWVGLGGAVVACGGALALLLPARRGRRVTGARRARPGRTAYPSVDPHERARRTDEASWSALSRGEDPTAAPGRPVDGAAGTMGPEGQDDPPHR